MHVIQPTKNDLWRKRDKRCREDFILILPQHIVFFNLTVQEEVVGLALVACVEREVMH